MGGRIWYCGRLLYTLCSGISRDRSGILDQDIYASSGIASLMVDLKETIRDLLNLGEDAADEEDGYGSFRMENISPELVVIPDTSDITEVNTRYPLIKPFAEAHIYWDDDEESLIYDVREPPMNEREEQIFDDLRHALEEKIDVPLSKLDTTEKILDYLEEKIDSTAAELGYRMTGEEKNKIMYYVYRNFAGINELEPLMHDPHIEDIGCSGLGIPVYIVHSKFGSIQTSIVFDDEEQLKNLVIKLAERANKYVSYADPLLDGTLPDGSRVNASLTQDVTTKGPTFSIRKFQEIPYSAIDLIEFGTVNYDLMAYMWMALQYQKSMLIIGGTATGKTTFLNSVVTFIQPEQKIVSIEDTRELQLPHENWIPSVTRTGVGKDSSEQEINMYQLLRESFRQNPDYVVVGEVRGKEASVLFQGMASGHPSLSTMHASAPSDVVSRLTTPPINLSPSLVETLDVIVSVTHAGEYGKNARRIKAIYEVEDISDEGSLRTNEYFSWSPVDDTFNQASQSSVLDKIGQQFGFSQGEIEDELEDRRKILKWMHENGYSQFSQVAQIVSEYYSNKEKVMAVVNSGEAANIESLLEQDAVSSQLPADIDKSLEDLENSIQTQDADSADMDESGAGNVPMDAEDTADPAHSTPRDTAVDTGGGTDDGTDDPATDASPVDAAAPEADRDTGDTTAEVNDLDGGRDEDVDINMDDLDELDDPFSDDDEDDEIEEDPFQDE